jgi:DNA-binding GntR family transcriptional regulator
MEIIKSDPLHLQLYAVIKKRLVQGEYQPGERIVETRLAESFQISRAPVREAIRMLIQDGLLEQRGKNVLVYQPNHQEIVNLFLCRQNLESLAARLAADRAIEEQKEALLEIVRLTREAWTKEDGDAVFELNTKFHHTIAIAAANDPLLHLINTIEAKVMYARNVIFIDLIRNVRFIDQHESIARAIIQQNPNLAEAEMKNHLQYDIEAAIKKLNVVLKDNKINR